MGGKSMKGEKMRYKVAIILITGILLGGCATTSPNTMSEEDFNRVKSGEMVIVNNHQSHGLVGDILHNILPHPK